MQQVKRLRWEGLKPLEKQWTWTNNSISTPVDCWKLNDFWKQTFGWRHCLRGKTRMRSCWKIRMPGVRSFQRQSLLSIMLWIACHKDRIWQTRRWKDRLPNRYYHWSKMWVILLSGKPTDSGWRHCFDWMPAVCSSSQPRFRMIAVATIELRMTDKTYSWNNPSRWERKTGFLKNLQSSICSSTQIHYTKWTAPWLVLNSMRLTWKIFRQVTRNIFSTWWDKAWLKPNMNALIMLRWIWAMTLSYPRFHRLKLILSPIPNPDSSRIECAAFFVCGKTTWKIG